MNNQKITIIEQDSDKKFSSVIITTISMIAPVCIIVGIAIYSSDKPFRIEEVIFCIFAILILLLVIYVAFIIGQYRQTKNKSTFEISINGDILRINKTQQNKTVLTEIPIDAVLNVYYVERRLNSLYWGTDLKIIYELPSQEPASKFTLLAGLPNRLEFVLLMNFISQEDQTTLNEFLNTAFGARLEQGKK